MRLEVKEDEGYPNAQDESHQKKITSAEKE
jgi:hypothetical protein